MTAADRLRASVAALPEEIRDVWAPNRGADQIVGAKYAVDPIDFVVGDDLETSVMEHIALAASPDRVLALADLLDTIERTDSPHWSAPGALREILAARDRLTALIEGSPDA